MSTCPVRPVRFALYAGAVRLPTLTTPRNRAEHISSSPEGPGRRSWALPDGGELPEAVVVEAVNEAGAALVVLAQAGQASAEVGVPSGVGIRVT